MICINCRKPIPKGKETTFKDLKFKGLRKVPKLVICEECSKNITNRCHTCEWPIYKNDLFYEITVSRGAEYFINASEEVKKIQCNPCYYDWLKKQKRKLWTRWGLLVVLISLVIWSLFIILPIFHPKLKESWKQTSLFNRYILIVLLFAIPIVTTYLMIQEFSSRYKVRERKS